MTASMSYRSRKNSRLRPVPRETVDDEPVVPVVLVEALVHDLLHQVVANKLARRHDPTNLGTELGVVLDVPAKDVADADLGHVEITGEYGRLGALAASLGSHQHVLPHVGTVTYLDADDHRLPESELHRVADDRTRHAVAATATAAEFRSDDGDDFDTRLAKQRVGLGVAVVGEDDTGLDGDGVVAAVPLLALGGVHVAPGLDDPQLGQAERLGHDVDEPLGTLVGDLDARRLSRSAAGRRLWMPSTMAG